MKAALKFAQYQYPMAIRNLGASKTTLAVLGLGKLVFASALALASVTTTHAAITSAFDGNWYDPVNSGQGFIFETYPQGKDLMLMVIFFTYDAEGRPTFFTGSTLVSDSTLQMDLLRPTVGPQVSPGVFGAPNFVPVGTLRLSFEGCSLASAQASFDANATNGANFSKIRVGSGSFRLQRLGNTFQRKRCTGGLSDNNFATDAPAGLERTIITPQFNVRSSFQQRPDGTEFNLSLRGLPVGSYQLMIGGVPVEGFNAQPFGIDTKAEIRFRSPSDSFSRLLDFDVLGQSFRVLGSESRTQSIDQEFIVDGDLTPINNGNVNANPFQVPLNVGERFGLAQITGAARGARADFIIDSKFERDAKRGQFRLIVEGAEPGRYEVVVGIERRGTLLVTEDTDGRRTGEILFRDPVTPGSYTLDFDPRGQELRLVRDGVEEFRTSLRN